MRIVNPGDTVKVVQIPPSGIFVVVAYGTKEYPPTREGPSTLVGEVVGQVGEKVWVKMQTASGPWTFWAWIR